jgi:very-short-patch-repair endonuclease
MPFPEDLLWGQLRNRGLDGLKFRRQAPVGPFIADFLCDEHRLIVELDGSRTSRPRRSSRTGGEPATWQLRATA